MAVLIEGMEMPKDGCLDCIFVNRKWHGDICSILKREVTVNVERGGFQTDCPLVPVPPHGLIDRERILDSIRIELAQVNAVNDMEDYDSWMRVFDYVRKFPTVIPASEEGEA